MRGFLLTLTILAAAFLWGYERDAIILWARSLWRQEQTPPALPVKAAPAATVPPAAQAAPPVVRRPQTANYADAMDAYRRMNQGAAGPPVPPQGPAQPPPQGALSQTLDSIQPGQVTNDQLIRRNAYFEKLSQQLKELRGEAPAAVPEKPTENAANDNPAPQPPQQEELAAPPAAEQQDEVLAPPPPPYPPEPPPAPVADEAARLQQEIDDLLGPQ